MTTSKGIILLLLEQNSVPLLAPGCLGFFPQKIGWSWKFTLPLLPWIGEDLGAGAPGADLKAKCTCLMMELSQSWSFKVGNMDLVKAA